MLRIGITGQSGFIGTHLFNRVGTMKDRFERVPFRDEFFGNFDALCSFVGSCDVIVHLAGVNRHNDAATLYDLNVMLARKLKNALESSHSKAHVIFSSSTQEERDNPYGKSKREGRLLLAEWARKNNASFTGFIIPNVFGPYGNPFYNSVIATFSHQLTHGGIPVIDKDAELNLIYVDDVVKKIIESVLLTPQGVIQQEYPLAPNMTKKVSEILMMLNHYKSDYFESGRIPLLRDSFELNLFNSFRGFIDIDKVYPVKLIQNTDTRGAFTEVMRSELPGQVSFSTTLPGITRGDHYHTRKIERFIVIKGEARIQLRRIGANEILNFFLSGAEPAYVDMPVWYTHNITNIGNEPLYTIFWINEPYNPDDPDTYFETVAVSNMC